MPTPDQCSVNCLFLQAGHCSSRSTAQRVGPSLRSAINTTEAPQTRAEMAKREGIAPSAAIATGRPGEYTCGVALGKFASCDQFDVRTMPLPPDEQSEPSDHGRNIPIRRVRK